AELRLDDRYQMIDEIGQFEIDDVRLQVRHAVLHRAAVDEKLGIVGDVDFARGRVDGDGPGAGRDRVADLSGDRERSRPVVRRGAKSLAQIEGRRDGAERISAYGGGAGFAPLDDDRSRHDEFALWHGQELVLERGLQVLEPVDRGTSRRADPRPG